LAAGAQNLVSQQNAQSVQAPAGSARRIPARARYRPRGRRVLGGPPRVREEVRPRDGRRAAPAADSADSARADAAPRRADAALAPALRSAACTRLDLHGAL